MLFSTGNDGINICEHNTCIDEILLEKNRYQKMKLLSERSLFADIKWKIILQLSESKTLHMSWLSCTDSGVALLCICICVIVTNLGNIPSMYTFLQEDPKWHGNNLKQKPNI